jgi:hypothetical protein
MKPYQDKWGDFPIQAYPQLKKPYCDRWFHGPVKGTTGRGRDWARVYDYCQEGDATPDCHRCKTIDSIGRDRNTWDKVYSHETESCQAPDKRVERHVYCGSYLRFESEEGQSIEYSEGCGHIRLGNATCEARKRGHLNFQGADVSGIDGVGTWDLHTNHEECPLADECQGVRFSGVRPEDMQVDWAYELMNFPTQSYVRCYKDGKIVINSCKGNSVITIDGVTNKITIDGTADVEVKATDKITLNAPITDVLGDLHVYQDEEVNGHCSGPNNNL